MRLMSLPGRVLMVAIAAMLPLAILCGIALVDLGLGQRAQSRDAAIGMARAVAGAVDSELRLAISSLQTLALTDPLGATDLSTLADAHLLASALRASNPGWEGVQLTTPEGHVVFSSERPFGITADQVLDLPSHAEAVRTRRPVVSGLFSGSRDKLLFAVRVPVLRGGQVRHVLTAIVKPETVAAVLRNQQVPDGWKVSVFDSNQLRIARSVNDELTRGRPPGPTLREALVSQDTRAELLRTVNTDEGVPMQTAIVRLASARWQVVLGMPMSTVDSAWRRTMWAYSGGVLFSLLAGGLGVWWVARTITRPMRRLRESALALGHGEPVAPNRSGIDEVDRVSHALAEAATDRIQHEEERDTLLVTGQQALLSAQAAQQRLQWLATVSTTLSRSLEEASTIEAIAQVIVPDFADICRIDLLDENDMLHRKLARYRNLTRASQVTAAVARAIADTNAPGSLHWAVTTGETFVVNRTTRDFSELPHAGLRALAVSHGIHACCVVPLVARGRTIGAMAVLQSESERHFSPEDVTLVEEFAQRAALALDNVRLLAQAHQARAEVEAASHAKDEFFAMLGHALRNPLAPISLVLQLMARKEPDVFTSERKMIERQVKQLSRMVDDLLDVPRIVAGNIVLQRERVDLRDVVTHAMELAQPLMQQRARMPGVVLPTTPIMVLGDALRLAQLVSNLLNNAAKFTPPAKSITVALAVVEGQAELSVSDEGVGIDSALLPHVFDRFVQAGQSLQRPGGGLGLGLAIARSLAELHGGTIDATSDGAGKGTTFHLMLPLAPPLPDACAIEHIDASPAGPPLRLLFVDDNQDAVNLLADWYRLEGHSVRVAYSAEKAFERLYESPVDAVVVDIGLPDISGYEFARRVRANGRWPSMALVALTGYGQARDRRASQEAGFGAHFAKPADLHELLAELRRLVADAGCTSH
ncbi:ATP-binding protein [Variovorax ginsengisoli]|uniref:histidine kinase n=1 Tax=Variovorax ginsengisoli TaxID=363844 RepID=A0ABT9S3V6_9BURK|nr:ATP-binding protein [Variovorax ginsengisoli]MDP9899022.1 signal transduction histidine kinase/ActR/RegA family two-component response regulator [Variovorax ginsengisoli]